VIASHVGAAVRFEFSGELRSAEGALVVEARLKNIGDSSALQVGVSGLLLEHTAEARAAEVKSSELAAFELRFPPDVPRPGTYALPLLIDFQDAAAGQHAPRQSQRAFLLLGIGGNPAAALQLSVASTPFETAGIVEVEVRSADAAPHRVEVRVFTPRGLNVDPPATLDVPGSGVAVARIRVLRAGAARASRHGILAVARPLDGALERAAVATGAVEVLPDPALLPKLRRPLLVLGAVLVAAALALELLERRRAGASAASGS
jgi:hypothetical protein